MPMGASRVGKSVEEDEAPAVAPASSDEEEANCDLSLEIVERAKRRAVQTVADGVFAAMGEESVRGERKRKSGKEDKKKKKKKRAGVEEICDAVEMKESKRKQKKREKTEQYCEVLGDVEFEGSKTREMEKKTTETVPVEEAVSTKSKKKRKKKKRKQRGDGREEVVRGNMEVVDATTQGETALTLGKEEPAGSQDSSVTDLNESSDPDNAVLRKLLRIPRYFDTENTTWKVTCFNCGEEGHYGTNCTTGKREKPCFLCGEFGHNSKRCPRGVECFVCKQVGHAAKDCTKKQKKGPENLKFCLRCGENGHEMYFCTNGYSSEDLNQIQCYICGKTGHLCCLNFVDAGSMTLSCYNCGQTGHTGFGCAKPRWQISANDSATVCHLCGEQGHFARGCMKKAESARRRKESSTRKQHIDRELTIPRWSEAAVSTPERKHDWNRQFSGSRSAPYEGNKNKSVIPDQRNKTARKPRTKNGGTLVGDVDSLSNKKYRYDNGSSLMPAHKLDFENRSRDPPSHKKQRPFYSTQRPLVSVNNY